jgi:hypothetical protein
VAQRGEVFRSRVRAIACHDRSGLPALPRAARVTRHAGEDADDAPNDAEGELAGHICRMVEPVQERADEKAAKKASEQSHCSSQNYAFGRFVLTHLANPYSNTPPELEFHPERLRHAKGPRQSAARHLRGSWLVIARTAATIGQIENSGADPCRQLHFSSSSF